MLLNALMIHARQHLRLAVQNTSRFFATDSYLDQLVFIPRIRSAKPGQMPTYVPPHLRDNGKSPRRAGSSEPPTVPFGPNLKYKKPGKAYMLQANGQSTSAAPGGKPTLLILDLNNNLLARKSRKASAAQQALPRPFLGAFLQYIFSSEKGQRRFEVMVWSSAQPANVYGMSRAIGLVIPELESNPAETCQGSSTANAIDVDQKSLKLIACWTRDNLGLSPGDYANRVETIKDVSSPQIGCR